MIKSGSKVKLHYTLSVDGEVLEDSKGGEPLSYVHGEGQIIPGLEEQLEGLGAGEQKSAEVAPEKGYGVRQADAVQEVPRTAFRNPEQLKVDDVVTGQAGDQPIRARIAEVKPESFVIDLNHPLAGKTLHFAVEIVDVS
jgi:FKBP-type peptidyl-prolyl cis-trans isomerase SlyD